MIMAIHQGRAGQAQGVREYPRTKPPQAHLATARPASATWAVPDGAIGPSRALGSPVLEWWFWPAVGVAALGVLVAIGLLTTGPLNDVVRWFGRLLWSIPHTFWEMYVSGGASGGAGASTATAGTAGTAGAAGATAGGAAATGGAAGTAAGAAGAAGTAAGAAGHAAGAAGAAGHAAGAAGAAGPGAGALGGGGIGGLGGLGGVR